MEEEYAKINEVLKEHPPYSPEANPEIYWRFTMDRPISEIDVVIVGENPGDPSLSCGLAFSYPKNFSEISDYAAVSWIMRELEDSVRGFQRPETGDLSPWSRRGVLLMNSDLTKSEKSRDEDPHKSLWWEITNAIAIYIARHNSGVIFMLWGLAAMEKRDLIAREAAIWIKGRSQFTELDQEKLTRPPPLILECYHPNHRERQFNGSNQFALCRKYQKAIKKKPTDWRLP